MPTVDVHQHLWPESLIEVLRRRAGAPRLSGSRLELPGRGAVDIDLGLCCGAGPHHVRSLAEAIGRTPPASRYSPDMSKHAYFGTDESLQDENVQYAKDL